MKNDDYELVPRSDGLAWPELAQPSWLEFWGNNGGPASVVGLRFLPFGEEPVAVFRLFQRDLVCDHVTLSCLAIGGVFTHPAERGKGHASQLLRRAFTLSRLSYSVALLFSKEERDLYRKLGFRPLRTELADRGLFAAPLVPGLYLQRSAPWRLSPAEGF